MRTSHIRGAVHQGHSGWEESCPFWYRRESGPLAYLVRTRLAQHANLHAWPLIVWSHTRIHHRVRIYRASGLLPRFRSRTQGVSGDHWPLVGAPDHVCGLFGWQVLPAKWSGLKAVCEALICRPWPKGCGYVLAHFLSSPGSCRKAPSLLQTSRSLVYLVNTQDLEGGRCHSEADSQASMLICQCIQANPYFCIASVPNRNHLTRNRRTV